MSEENEEEKYDLKKLVVSDKMPSFMESAEKDAISRMYTELEQKKEEVIRAKLLEMGKSEDFIDSQKTRRFKDIACERVDSLQKSEETWWLNDGSETGQRIVTFVMVKGFPSFDSSMNHVSMGFKYEYY